MEISYLDYEKTKITDSTHPLNPSSSTPDEIETGFIQYDPNEKVILFYLSTSKFSFMVPVSEITILSEYLNRSKIAFTHNGYFIQIYNQKKETLGEKTMKFLYNVLRRKLKNETKKNCLSGMLMPKDILKMWQMQWKRQKKRFLSQIGG